MYVCTYVCLPQYSQIVQIVLYGIVTGMAGKEVYFPVPNSTNMTGHHDMTDGSWFMFATLCAGLVCILFFNSKYKRIEVRTVVMMMMMMVLIALDSVVHKKAISPKAIQILLTCVLNIPQEEARVAMLEDSEIELHNVTDEKRSSDDDDDGDDKLTELRAAREPILEQPKRSVLSCGMLGKLGTADLSI